MRRVEQTDVDDAAGEFMNLAAAALGAGRCAAMAEELSARCARLVELVAGLPAGTPNTGALAFLRRRAQSAARAAERSRTAAGGATAALGDAVASHAWKGESDERRRSASRVRKDATRASKAFGAARHEACRAVRTAAGVGAHDEPADGPEPLWREVMDLLRRLPLGEIGDEEVIVTLAGADADRRAIAGLVAHVAVHAPALLVAEVAARPGRYVQVLIDADDRAYLESVSDAFLDDGDALDDEARHALLALGFEPPDDDHLNWHCASPVSVSRLGDILHNTLVSVHGALAGDDVSVTLDRAANHPDNVAAGDDPAALDLDDPSLPALAAALAARLADSIDVVGVDRIWATVNQPGWAYFAHLGSNMDGGLFTEVAGNSCLDPENHLDARRLARLRALGWEDPTDDSSDDAGNQPRNHTRIWPAPFDLHTACWHVALTLLAVYGLDLDEPVFVEVGLFE